MPYNIRDFRVENYDLRCEANESGQSGKMPLILMLSGFGFTQSPQRGKECNVAPLLRSYSCEKY
jgi:hypothetical protein